MHVERTFTVSRSVEDVFDYLSNFENTEEWDPGTLSTRLISGEGGLGTQYANRSEFMGREVDLTYETIGYDRPTFFSCRGTNKNATATDSMTFTRMGERTQIHYRADFEFRGIAKWVAPFMVKPKLDSLADETIADIRQALESD